MEIHSVSLANYSSLRVGGEGKVCIVTTREGLREAYIYAKERNLVVHILGEGTNTYFGTALDHFLFVKIQIRGIEWQDEGETVLLTAAGGEVWDDIVSLSCDRGLWGIENLSLIPGTVGASPVQNIGAYGVELRDTFISLQALDTVTMEIVTIKNDACHFGYRDSLFKQEKGRYVITHVTLRLQKIAHPILTYKPLDVLMGRSDLSSAEIRDVVIHTRRAKLPDQKVTANNGSFFKNPVVTKEEAEELQKKYPNIVLHEAENGYKVPAAWLIDTIAEMKGVRVGDVGTWPTQPLVIINHGNAAADDIDTFANAIREKVRKATGIVLEQEVNRVG